MTNELPDVPVPTEPKIDSAAKRVLLWASTIAAVGTASAVIYALVSYLVTSVFLPHWGIVLLLAFPATGMVLFILVWNQIMWLPASNGRGTQRPMDSCSASRWVLAQPPHNTCLPRRASTVQPG